VRILLANQFYPPDVAPTGQVLQDLARCLVDRGHDVTVLCSQRSYDGEGDFPAHERREGVTVRRVRASGFGRQGAGRAADYVSYLAAAAAAARGLGRFDASVCLTTPPFLGWTLARALGPRAGQRVQWVMDVYPDVLRAHGGGMAGIVSRLLRPLARRQLDGALVVALGPQMAARLAPYAARALAVEVVPLWGDPGAAAAEDVRGVRARRGWTEGRLVLLYSGNMGLGHRLQEFLDAAVALQDEAVTWAFAGGGRRRGEVEAFARDHPRARIEVLPYVEQDALAASLAAADVHLVSLRSGWQGLVVPSKLQAAFAAGRPVVYVGPRDSEAWAWTEASGGGWTVDEGDVAALVRAARAAADPGERSRRGEAARRFAAAHFDRATNTARIAALVESRAARNR
jgi:colanic acid biosynthesis glycosyl transferase WcaI